MKNKPKQITISVKKYATGGQLKSQNNAGMNPYLYNSLPQYGLGSWLAENAGTIGTVAGGILGSVIPGAGTALGASIGGAIGGGITNMHNQSDANAQQAEQVQLQQQQIGVQNAMNNYKAQEHPMYGTNFAMGGFMPNVNTWQYSNVGGMNYGNGGGVQPHGVPIHEQSQQFADGGSIADSNFWGYQNGKYTPEYINSVNSIVTNDWDSAKKYMTDNNIGYAQTPEGFRKAALDGKVGDVHKYIYNTQLNNSNKPIFQRNDSIISPKWARGNTNDFYRKYKTNIDNSIQGGTSPHLALNQEYNKQGYEYLGLQSKVPPLTGNQIYNTPGDSTSNLVKKYTGQKMANGGQLGNDNGAAQMTKGLDNITVYPKSAGTHQTSSTNGIPIGNKGLVEGGETRINGYIFSNKF